MLPSRWDRPQRDPNPEFLGLIGFHLLVLFGAALLASRGRLSRSPLVAGLTVWVACGFILFSVQGWVRIRYFEAFTPAVAAALGIALTSLRRSHLLLIAVLAWPLWTSIEIARSGRHDSETLGAQPPGSVQRLDPYAGHLAVSSAVLAGPLIVRDAQPLTILTSWKGHGTDITARAGVGPWLQLVRLRS
jgi:hypothetical protein